MFVLLKRERTKMPKDNYFPKQLKNRKYTF